MRICLEDNEKIVDDNEMMLRDIKIIYLSIYTTIRKHKQHIRDMRQQGHEATLKVLNNIKTMLGDIGYHQGTLGNVFVIFCLSFSSYFVCCHCWRQSMAWSCLAKEGMSLFEIL